MTRNDPPKRKLSKISKDQINHLTIAMGMASVPINAGTAELILLVQDGMKRYGGDFDLHTACDIHTYIQKKYSKKPKKNKS